MCADCPDWGSPPFKHQVQVRAMGKMRIMTEAERRARIDAPPIVRTGVTEAGTNRP